MIVTQQKPFEETLDLLKGYNKIFIIGCGECATVAHTGGEREALAYKAKLEARGKEIVGFCIPQAPCISPVLKKELVKNIDKIKQADAILILSCGAGLQSLKENLGFDLIIVPGCNSLFSASVDKFSNFFEVCSNCGDCILGKTGGICPVTRCSKNLLNGPCGGAKQGKCEIDQNRDCAWVLIYKELLKYNQLDNLKAFNKPKDHSKNFKPQKLLRKN
ncbi:MAG: methylenetetrahydrofolate reductase C-terminal domain-containing protein [Candidatus Omnitrophota bacterium]